MSCENSGRTDPARFRIGLATMNSPRFRHAFEYAATLHAADLRKGARTPYLSHLLEVCAIVIRYGGNEDVAIAALLHDAAEDHGGAPRLVDIQRNFGKAVASIVEECTDSTTRPKQPWEVRKRAYVKHLPESSRGGLLVSAADKLSNVRAILSDHYVIGEEVYKRFKRPKRRTLWYYNALSKAFTAYLGGDLSKELRRTVAELNRVSKYRARR
jgi:(p)ppGpp synthase/HD superfamily hydrolase